MQWFSARFGPHTRASGKPRLLILMYHRILPRDDERFMYEEPGMVVTPATFDMHMDLVSNYFQPVHLADWADWCATGDELPDKACAITFDDGWSDNYDYAFPILQKRNIPATIFLVSEMVGKNEMFWPERLAQLLVILSRNGDYYSGHPTVNWLKDILPTHCYDWKRQPDPEDISAAIGAAKLFADEEIHKQINHILIELNLELPQKKSSILDWQQISDMASTGLIDTASHTRTHIRLGPGNPIDVLESEIAGSKVDIEQKTGHSVSAFCYPNGDYSSQALEMVRKHYRCAVTTHSGWNTCSDDMHLLRRIAIHEDIANDKTSFLARVSGWV